MDTTTSETNQDETKSPIDQLLALGDCTGQTQWPDYLALGLTDEHIPELIQIVTNSELSAGDGSRPEEWGPVHAWRTLGLLQAEAAIDPLLPLLHDLVDDDWARDELPTVLGMIGPAAISPLEQYLSDPTPTLFARVGAGIGLSQVAVHHPEAREEAVAALVRQLEQPDGKSTELTSFIISTLMDIKAVEAMPAIQQAYEADRVDVSIPGYIEDVEYEMGLRDAPPDREGPNSWMRQVLREARVPQPAAEAPAPAQPYQKPRRPPGISKAKRKQVEKSRKQNRKKKKK